jgi:hypothetical protein
LPSNVPVCCIERVLLLDVTLQDIALTHDCVCVRATVCVFVCVCVCHVCIVCTCVQEMLAIMTSIYDMMGRYTSPSVRDDDPSEHVDKFFQVHKRRGG